MSSFCTAIILASFVLISTATSQSHCPSTPLPNGCLCQSADIYCTPLRGTKIVELFRALEHAISTEEVFDNLFFTGSKLDDDEIIVPFNTLQKLKFRSITFQGFNKPLGINPEAFPSTYTVTEDLAFSTSSFSTHPFFFVQKFKSLRNLRLQQCRLKRIPVGAISGMKKLVEISIQDGNTFGIANVAFEDTPSLKTIFLGYNSLNVGNIQQEAFHGINPNTSLDITGNSQITHLTQEKFQHFLDNTNKGLWIGGIEESPEHLVCDKKADWICDKAEIYKPKLHGFHCKDSEHSDVFAYCAKSSSIVNPLPPITFYVVLSIMLPRIPNFRQC